MTNFTDELHYKPSLADMTIQPLEIEQARQICEWQYDPPYDLYRWPSWDTMQKDEIEFGDPVLRCTQYAAVVNRVQELIGFAQFFPLVGVTRLGLGLHPALCSKGIGTDFTRLLVREAVRRAPQNSIDLEVLTWNNRAIRAYERAGFIIDDTYVRQTPDGPAEFHCMVYQSNP
ncbi:Protein N-acetyltransferase, RimJ/RimL family [Paenibacillus catalpae]|uniref:Protein N-acetyltransferase, RimJ/RimL family n=1 Tax=Paenibacillus catalpae TaxID=1045775 RepID=A0A1I2I250_9BACL|nr:GNAT family N-acetyltransferase [Paenibacillus catalpae]SFF34996.1 Protein N-acetyltransferase, RimJ/RimL family [Paenibacillus catalpae]